MKFFKLHLPLAFLASMLFSNWVLAETRYISDTLIVSLREEASLQGEVKSYLRSGDRLEVLEEDDDGFIRVRTAKGEEGWMQKKYTIDDKPKDLIIAELEQTVERLQGKVEAASSSSDSLKSTTSDLRGQLAEQKQEIDSYKAQISQIEEALKAAEYKYADFREKAQDVEAIVTERDSLQAQTQNLDQEVAMLRAKNEELVRTDRLLWFLAGFGVFMVGWLMGKFARKSRRSSLSL